MYDFNDILKYKYLIQSVVVQYLSVNDEDICHDILIKAYEFLPSFRKKCSLSTVLYTIAKNYCINYKKKNKILYNSDYLRKLHSNNYILNNLIVNEAYYFALEGIELLSEKQKKTFKRIVYDEYTHKQVAIEMNVTIGTVKRNFFEARRHIKEYIASKYIGGEY